MDIELEKLKKLEHALCDAIDILRDWQVEEAKPEEEKWIAYLARFQDGLTLCRCDESYWKFAKEFDGAKTKLFVGSMDEAREWCKNREKFAYVIKAWEDGKQIQCRRPIITTDWVNTPNPTWEVGLEYRIKPDCPCEEGIDSKACVGCPQDEERKRKRIEERASKFGEVCVHPEYDDEKCKECNECIEGPDYRPFKDCDELVEFWTKRYQTGFRPAHTKPLIWVRLKCDGRERLIVAFGEGFGNDFVEIGNKAKAVTLQKLFEDYEFLDWQPCGVEVKE